MIDNETRIYGYTLKEIIDKLHDNCSAKVNKALNYLDGKQEDELIQLLNDPQKGRKDWRNRGFIPRFRNLVKPIVTHSGMLFKDNMPVFQIFDKNSQTVNEQSTKFLNEELSKLEFHETCSTLDELTRLLKTVLVLIQYNIHTQELVHTLLHRGNSMVLVYESNITVLVYHTDDNMYRIMTPEFIYDIAEDSNKQPQIISQIENGYGFIPAVPFYDTDKPRCGFWYEPGMDLININEQYNLHLTDSSFSLAWAKMPTLYTNCKMNVGGVEQYEVVQHYGQKLPSLQESNAGIIGGPNKAIVLDSVGVDNPFVEYKAPVFDISSMDAVQQQWVKNVAEDWSVRLNMSGSGHANSGFQLIVEEMPNMELRKQRQKMICMGFKRWYKIVSKLYTILGVNTLPEDAELYVEFNLPQLPVDTEQEERIWTERINNNRASRVDYLMVTQGLSRDEAELKLSEINKYNTINTTTDINIT